MGQDRFTVVYAKTEGVAPGTDSVPVATDALLLASADFTPEVETYRRPVNDSLARPMRAGIAIPRTIAFALRQELRGSGNGAYGVGGFDGADAYPQGYHLLTACGLTGTFAVDTWTFKLPAKGEGTLSSTIYLHKDGLLYKGLMCRGNPVFDLQLGKPPMVDYAMTGIFAAPTAVAVPTPDYTTGTTGLFDVAPPILVGATLDFDPYGDAPSTSQTGHVSNIKIDLRNTVEAVESSTVGTGAVGMVRHLGGHGDAADDGISLTFDVEYHDEGGGEEVDWWTRYLSQTVERVVANLHLVMGTVAGNILTLQLGGLHLVSVTPAVLSGGRLGFNVEARLMGTAASVSEDDLVLTIA